MPGRIERLVGVYDADGTLRGELSYWLHARVGRAHCALCDITHGLVRVKGEWKDSRASLPVEFETFHRDDQPDAVRAGTGDVAPVVVAVTDTGVVTLLGPDELEACAGAPARLVEAVRDAVSREHLQWPSP
jgi:hypothetical protein